MAATAEMIEGPSGSLGSRSRMRIMYQVHDAADYGVAYNTVLSQLATDYPNGYPLDLVLQSIDPQYVGTPRDNAGEWQMAVNLINPGGKKTEPPVTGESSVRFEIGRDRRRIKYSRKTVGLYARNGKDAPSMGGAINVTDKDIEGCELGDTSGAMHYSITKYKANDELTVSYLGGLVNMIYTTNAAFFSPCGIGQVLFLGVSGGRRGVGDWELTFNFAARGDVADACAEWPSDSGFGSGNGAGAKAIPVKAWEYMWVYYMPENKLCPDDKNRLLLQPKFVYVEQLYDSSDFDDLGI